MVTLVITFLKVISETVCKYVTQHNKRMFNIEEYLSVHLIQSFEVLHSSTIALMATWFLRENVINLLLETFHLPSTMQSKIEAGCKSKGSGFLGCFHVKSLPFLVIQLYVHTNDIDVKSFSGYSRDVGKWFWPKITWGALLV